jgi:hypothetical protein
VRHEGADLALDDRERLPASRSPSVSPTHTIGRSPASSIAAFVFSRRPVGLAEELAALAVPEDHPRRARRRAASAR